MRKRIPGAVAAVLAAVLVLALLNVDFLVRRNQDYLIGRAEQALGRKITVDRIETTLWPIGARMINFALADDPAFSPGDFLRAEHLRVELQLLPLFIGQFRPKRIALESPRLTIVRDAAGRYNFASAARDEKSVVGRADVFKTNSPDRLDNRLFLILAFNIIDGTLHYRDLRNGGGLVVSKIKLKAGDFEPGRAFGIEMEAAVAADEPNLQLHSQIGPMGGNRDYRDVLLEGEINAEALDLGMVNKALPQLTKALPRALRFDGVYTIKELKFTGTLNNLSLKGAVTGSDASFRFE